MTTLHPPTRTGYLAALKDAIRATGWDWLDQPVPDNSGRTKLDRFMEQAALTLSTDRNAVAINTPSFVNAWRAIGMKGRPTYKALRTLPNV